MLSVDRTLLEARVDELDRAVSQTRDIDQFCSSSAWVLSAHDALHEPRELACWQGEHGWALFARQPQDRWTALTALEASWCLACPFACPSDPVGLAQELVLECARLSPPDVVFLSGLVPGSALLDAIVRAFGRRHRLLTTAVPPTTRYRASLDDGVDGFLGRRSPSFRTRLRQAARKAAQSGVRFEPIACDSEDDARTLHARLIAVESKSWKGLAGDGLLSPRMAELYRLMLPRLARRGAVRAHVGRLEGEDVAIIVGGVIDTPDGVVYRGLQFSFDDAYRPLALGNLAQLAQITALAEEKVSLYDLGSDVDYKRRWGEQTLTTITLVAVPR